MIRRSISFIFGFFSALVMLINLAILIIFLCYQDLLNIIKQGARPPTLINIAILAEAGSENTQDAMAQAHIDLLIAKGFTERYMFKKEERRRILQETIGDDSEAEEITPVLTLDIDDITDRKSTNAEELTISGEEI